MFQASIAFLVYAIGPLTLLGYLSHRFYFAGGRCKSKKRLDGKVAIVTGANYGVGYGTALDFARRGAHVILACRNIKRAQPAADKIKLETNNNNVEVEIIDLASLQSVRDFADRIKKRFKRIDILVNNAAIVVEERTETADGFELTWQTNHLGPFLLTNLLLDVIKASAPSRIVNVSSKGHSFVSIDWDDIQMQNSYFGLIAHVKTKLANVQFTKFLAKKLEGTGVIATSVHPGSVRTDVWNTVFDRLGFLKHLVWIIYPFVLVFMKSCEEGAQTTVYCALDDEEVPKHNGEYFADCRHQKMSKNGADMEQAERLWKLSAEMVGLTD